MTVKKLRYGLLGCGMMGREHLRNLALIDDVDVVAIAEPDLEMQRLCKGLAPNATIVSNLEALLEIKQIDAFVVATPNYQHSDQLLTLLAETSRPILIEKPLVTEASAIATVRDAAEKHPAPIWVAMEYRYMPPISYFMSQLDESNIGSLKMLSIREHRFPFLRKVDDWNRFNKNTGGTLVEKCCHFFDLIRFVMNEEASRIYASAGQDCNHLDEQYPDGTPDIIDNAFVTLDFSNGKRAMLDLNMFAEGSRYQEEISLVGSKAKVECLVPGPTRTWPKDTSPPTAKVIYSPRRPKGPVESEIPVDPALLAAGDHNGATYYQHLGFRDAILQDKPVAVSVADGLKAVVLGLAAQQSAATGQAVTISADGYEFSGMQTGSGQA